MGWVLSALSALSFGLSVLPRRHSPLPAVDYVAVMALAFGITGGLLWVGLAVVGAGAWLSLGQLTRIALSAAIWSAANFTYVLAIDRVGVARASAVKNLAGVFGTLSGLLLLRELAIPMRSLAAAAGSVGIVASATLVGGAAAAPQATPAPAPGKVQGTGFLLALAAALGLGLYLVPAEPLLHQGVTAVLLVAVTAVLASLWTLLGAAATGWLRGRVGRVDLRRGSGPAVAGVLWVAGTVLVTAATGRVGLAIAWPISQLSFYVTLAYGVWRLREFAPRQGRRLVLGTLSTLVGLVLLAFARS